MNNNQKTKTRVVSLPKDILRMYESYKYTPYFMNIGSAKLKKYVYVGKGSAEEIHSELRKLTNNK